MSRFPPLLKCLFCSLPLKLCRRRAFVCPLPSGTTVSILGGLVVGSAAVEAKIVSPAVLIVVAVSGIAGYTMPSQELSGALRLWRFGLVIAASISGIFGMTATAVVLVCHMASLESFGVPLLTPFAAVGSEHVTGVLRKPIPWVKLRERALKTVNRRNQK